MPHNSGLIITQWCHPKWRCVFFSLFSSPVFSSLLFSSPLFCPFKLILTYSDYIRIDQCLTVSGGAEVWAGKLEGGSCVVGLFNGASVSRVIALDWPNIFYFFFLFFFFFFFCLCCCFFFFFFFGVGVGFVFCGGRCL